MDTDCFRVGLLWSLVLPFSHFGNLPIGCPDPPQDSTSTKSTTKCRSEPGTKITLFLYNFSSLWHCIIKQQKINLRHPGSVLSAKMEINASKLGPGKFYKLMAFDLGLPRLGSNPQPASKRTVCEGKRVWTVPGNTDSLELPTQWSSHQGLQRAQKHEWRGPVLTIVPEQQTMTHVCRWSHEEVTKPKGVACLS